MFQTALTQQISAGIICALIFILVSYLVNKRLTANTLNLDKYLITLYATTVFLLAVICEVGVNTIYTGFIGEQLWQYHIMPRHGGDISLMAPLLWSAYGVHLYFVEQTYGLRLPAFLKRYKATALLHGFDAPLIFEVSGNLIFLALLGQYYAYYLPGDLFHLTSLRVIPIYIVCIFIGLLVLHWLEKQRRHWTIPAGLFSSGVVFLALA
ncbi:MAG: hypothetical protein OQK73_04095 [Gammaproteobacteria bacterium]|nr:hypothetical protein [Gammaproteobacteria bacterium]